jgi:hypothetical protein
LLEAGLLLAGGRVIGNIASGRESSIAGSRVIGNIAGGWFGHIARGRVIGNIAGGGFGIIEMLQGVQQSSHQVVQVFCLPSCRKKNSLQFEYLTKK